LITVNDKWLRMLLVAIPSGLFLFNFLTGNSRSLQANVVYILTTLLVCESSRFLIYRSRGWFKKPYRNGKRLGVLLPSGIALVSILFFFSKAWRNYLAFGVIDSALNPGVFTLQMNERQVGVGLIGSSLIYGLLTFLLLLGIYELAYHFARLRQAERERDRFEREKLQAELQQLKGIVNPHFLFNNLNSLSSLISEDPAQAEAFLDELTKVFRYLLRNNDTELTTLAQELQFMHSYYHLLQTRYGRAISMEINIDPACESFLLPPLTLQLLVENAVKHNRVHKEAPLRIELFSDGANGLVVRNNLSVREQHIESTGIGLRSINSRYNLLNHEPLTIRKEEGFFCVVIPLIPSGVAKAAVPVSV
jgi:sensor histidine kinase YesM